MIFSEYLDSVENTEQESKLIEQLGMIKDGAAWVVRIPLIGKSINALIALADSENIEAFKQSEHYSYLKDWNVTVFDHESAAISISPSDKIKGKIAKVLVLVGAAMLLMWLCRKFCCNRTKKEFEL